MNSGASCGPRVDSGVVAPMGDGMVEEVALTTARRAVKWDEEEDEAEEADRRLLVVTGGSSAGAFR